MAGLHGGEDAHVNEAGLVRGGNDLGVLHTPAQVGAGPFVLGQVIACFGVPVEQGAHGAVSDYVRPNL